MFKKGLLTLICLTVMTAMASWAATTFYVQIKTTNPGGTVALNGTEATGTGAVKYVSLSATSANPVVTPAATHKIASVTVNGAAVAIADPTAPLTVPLTEPNFLDATKASGYRNPAVVATFALRSATAMKTWQLQVRNNNVGGVITTTRGGVAFGSYPVGKLVLKNFTDTAPITVKVVANSGYSVKTVTLNGVPATLDSNNELIVNPASSVAKVFTVAATYKQNALTVTGGAGVLPASVQTSYNGSVTLMVSPTGTDNQVTGITVTGPATYTATDSTGKTVAPFKGVVKVALTQITGNVNVAATYGTDPKPAIYDQCSASCHQAAGGATAAVYAQWDKSSHSGSTDANGKLVDCINCHGTMPGPVVKSSVDANTFKVTAASAGTVGTIYCARCHTDNAPHTSVKAACTTCHSSTHNPAATAAASVSIASAGTPDVVDAGDSFLPAPTEFAGSNACRGCHANHFEGWTKSLHNKPSKYIANQGEAIFVNDSDSDGTNDFIEGINFNDADFATKYGYANPFANQIPNAPILKKVGSDYIIQIGQVEYQLNRTQGGNGYWKQRFYTEVGGGNYVLPVQWNEVQKRYSAYNPVYWYTAATSSTPRFSQPYNSIELLTAFKTAYAAGGDGPASSSWENRCAGCHQSGLTVKVQNGEVVSGYADLNVGCEACHGPAAQHVAAPTKSNVVNPNDYLSQTDGAFKAVETCGKCHQRGESKVYLGSGNSFTAGVGPVAKKVEAPARLSGDLTTAIFFPMGGDLFGGGWYTDNVGVFGTKGSMTYNDYPGFPAYVASNQHHQQWEDMEQGKHGANYAETTPGATKMACWSCHDLHSPKGSHNTKSKMTVNGTALTNLKADDNTLCLACHAGKGKFAGLTLSSLQAAPAGADVVAAVNAHVSARIPGKTITAGNYLAAGRKGGGSSTYHNITYRNGQCVSCHMPLVPSSTGVRIYADAAGRLQGDQHSHTMKTLLKPAGTSITSCSGCHGDFVNFETEKLQVKTVELGQAAPGVSMAAGFVGTNNCKSCHLEKYAEYTQTLHNKPLKTLSALGDSVIVADSNANGQNDFKDGLDFNTAPASVFQGGTNPWANMTLAGNAPKLSYESGKYYITIGLVKYEVSRTQGGNGKWKQRFHTKIGEGYYVLPVQFNEISKQYEGYNNTNWYKPNNTPWVTAGISNNDAATIAQVSTLLTTAGLKAEYPGFAGTGNQGTSTSSWDNRCSACHQTGVAIEYKEYNGIGQVVSSSADLNIGCESCHGGGKDHMQNPYAADSIINPAKFSNKFRANEVCGQCHSRTEGFAHFSSASGRVFAGVEAPSKIVEGSHETKAESYVLGASLLDYIEKVLPKSWKADGTSANTGLTAVAYDGATGKFVNGVAADGHHQQWHDLDSGPHGAAKGITCFSCHDAHKKTSGNIKTSTKMGGVTVATKSTDNSLCLTCHAGNGVFAAVTAADVAGIATNEKVDSVMDAVYTHLVQKAGYSADAAKKASWKSKYLQSVQADGTTSATFGIAVYKVGQCISCHMPYSAKSGIYTADPKNPTRKQGDQRGHSMKTLWSGLTDLTAQKGLKGTSSVTSCSACHAVKLTP